jgi:hypothetical protein
MVFEGLCFFTPSKFNGAIDYAGGGMNTVHPSGICAVRRRILLWRCGASVLGQRVACRVQAAHRVARI